MVVGKDDHVIGQSRQRLDCHHVLVFLRAPVRKLTPMDGVTHVDSTGQSESPSDGLEQNEADLDSLVALAKERRYAVRTGDPHRWLEWDDGTTPPPADPDVVGVFEWFGMFEPFEPFAYPALRGFLGSGPTLNTEWPTFLSHRPLVDASHPNAERGRGRVGVHVRELAGRLELDEDRRAAPDKLSWLIGYRDALAFDIRRCAARLESSPEGLGRRRSPLDGTRATLKVWLAEAVTHGGLRPAEGGRPVHDTIMAWQSFKGGHAWGDPRFSPASLLAQFSDSVVPRALAVATVAGLWHHARVRDQIVAPAFDVWPRLLAAETVLHAAITGTSLDEAWIEETVRQQEADATRQKKVAAEAEQREQERSMLRVALLDPQKRRAHILDVLAPKAHANGVFRSHWNNVYALLEEDWKEAGLPEDQLPFRDGRALGRAIQTAAHRDRKRKQAKK